MKVFGFIKITISLLFISKIDLDFLLSAKISSKGAETEYLNLQYHFILSGDSTDATDFRKPVKLKTPKAKAKIVKRPAAKTPRTEDDADDFFIARELEST